MDRVESMKVMRLARYLVWFILGWSGVYIGTQLLLHPSTRETYAYASPNHHFTAHSNHTVDLTIIIPCYNAGTLLRELFLALSESNARQEVIFAIAKSSDNTSHFVHKFVKGRPKMRVLEFDRRYHAGQLRNLALPYAMGEYLAFVDADDTIAAKALQCALEDALAFRPDVLVMPYVTAVTAIRAYFDQIDTIIELATSPPEKWEIMITMQCYVRFGTLNPLVVSSDTRQRFRDRNDPFYKLLRARWSGNDKISRVLLDTVKCLVDKPCV